MTDRERQVRETLSDDERPAYDELLEDYKASAHAIHGGRWISPRVIALLVVLGWRPDEDQSRPDRWNDLVREFAEGASNP